MIETIYSNPNELYHYGVKGMKWGQRKEEVYTARARRARTMAGMNERVAKSGGVLSGINRLNANYYNNRADKYKAAANNVSLQRDARNAKAEYKSAKKAYNKAFNKAYRQAQWHPISTNFTKKGSQKYSTLVSDALVLANESAIKKGKYIQAKGVAKSNPKQVAKGKFIVERAQNASAVYKKQNSLYKQGYRSNEVSDLTRNEYQKALERQAIITNDYRKNK